MRNASEVVREVGVNDFRMASEQQRFHLDYRLLGISPGALARRPAGCERRSPYDELAVIVGGLAAVKPWGTVLERWGNR